MILLSLWCWEHLLVGRPTPLGYDPWDDHGDPEHMPTWVFHWDKVEGFFGISKTQYLHYVNELNVTIPEHVTWEPFGTVGNIGRNITFALNPKCLNESHLWRMLGPLICYYAVELHLPHRVMTQFGLYQETPSKFKDTSFHLHNLDKIKTKGIKNWIKEHKPFDTAAFNRYLVWFRGVARTQLNPSAFDSEDILLEPNPGFNEMANLEYNKLIRTGRHTQLASIVRFLRKPSSQNMHRSRRGTQVPSG